MKTKLFLFSLLAFALLFTSCDFGKERRLRNIADRPPISVVNNETKTESETVNKESEPTETEFKRIIFEFTEPIKGFRVVEMWEKPSEGKCKHCGIAQEEKIWSGEGIRTLAFTSIATGRTFEFVDCGLVFGNEQKIYISDIQIPEINRNELVRLSDFFIRTEQGTSAWGFIDFNGDGQYTLITAFNRRGNRDNSTVRFFSLTTGRELTATTMYENGFLGASCIGLSVDLRNRRFVTWGIVASTSGNSRVYSYTLNHSQNRLTVRLLKELRSDRQEYAATHTFFQDCSVETQRPIPDDFWWNRENEHVNGYFDGWQFRRVSVVSQIRETLTRAEWERAVWFFNLENVYRGL